MFKKKKQKNLNEKYNKILSEIYSNVNKSNIAFTSIKNLYNVAKKFFPSISIKDVKNFLKTQDSYTLHKLAPKKFKFYRKVLAPMPKYFLSLDLIDMQKYSQYNDGVKYLIFLIDIFSRKIFVYPIFNKNKFEILKSLKHFFNLKINQNYIRIYSDLEGGLYSNLVLNFLKEKNIILYSNSTKEVKNSIAEANLKHLKKKIYKFLTHYNINRYIDFLPQIISGINNTSKRIFKNKFLTPNILHLIKNRDFLKKQFHLMYSDSINTFSKKKNIHSLKKYSYVRISLLNRTNIFSKSFEKVNSGEIFQIYDIDKSQYPFLYKLRDLSGEKILGSFYKDELTEVILKNEYKIKILKTKIDENNKKFYYVNYINYPKKFNEWISENQLI